MGNIITSGLAFVLSITAAVFALKAWRKAKGVPKKWLGWGGVVLLIPGLVLVIAIVAILLGGVGLAFIRGALALSIVTLFIGAAFIIYGAIALNAKQDKTEEEKAAVKDAIIAALVSGLGAAFIIATFFLKLSKKGGGGGISIPGLKK